MSYRSGFFAREFFDRCCCWLVSFHCSKSKSRLMALVFPRRGFIAIKGRYFVLEPTPGRSDGTHHVYSAEHLRFSSGTCGHNFNLSSSPAETNGTLEDSNPFRSFSSRVRVTPHNQSSSTQLADPTVHLV